MSRIRSIPRRRYITFAVMGILLIAGLSVFMYNGHANNKVVLPFDSQPKPQQAAVNIDQPAAALPTDNPPTGAGSTAPASKPPATRQSAPATAQQPTQPTQPAKSKPTSGYKPTACDQNRPAYYASYNQAITRENIARQQELAALEADYSSGEYDDYNDYAADVEAEQVRFRAATKLIYDNYNAQLRAAGCPGY